MSKSPENDEEKQIEQTKSIMAKLAAMPHKPHVDKSPAKAKKKGDGPTAKKNRRPQEG